MVFERCSVTGNSNGAEYGGAFRFTGSDAININQCTFVNNVATTSAVGAGGAIAVESGSPYSITNSSFYNNSATQRGGAITFQGGGDITIDNSTFKDNAVLAAIAVTGGGAFISSVAPDGTSSSTIRFLTPMALRIIRLPLLAVPAAGRLPLAAGRVPVQITTPTITTVTIHTPLP